MAQNGSGNAQARRGLQRVHERLHATHAPNPEAEAAPGGDQDVPVGAVRIEEGRLRNDDGSIHDTERAWKLYQLRELPPDEAEKYTAKRDDAGFPVGEQIVRVRWELVSQHSGEQEALDAAAKL